MVSAKFRPAARTAIRTSPEPTGGAGHSCTRSSSGPPVPVRTTAFMPRMYGLGLRRAEVLLAITSHERLIKEFRWKNRVVSDAQTSANFAESSAARTARAGATGRRLHELAIELAAMSQNGLHYATDRYDIARYERMRQIAAEVLSMIAAGEPGAGPSAEDFHRSLRDERGHATPKVDVRAALFDREERVLLVQEDPLFPVEQRRPDVDFRRRVPPFVTKRSVEVLCAGPSAGLTCRDHAQHLGRYLAHPLVPGDVVSICCVVQAVLAHGCQLDRQLMQPSCSGCRWSSTGRGAFGEVG